MIQKSKKEVLEDIFSRKKQIYGRPHFSSKFSIKDFQKPRTYFSISATGKDGGFIYNA